MSSRRFRIADSLPGFDDDYQKALAHNIWLGTEGSINYALRMYNLDAIIVPSRGECVHASASKQPSLIVLCRQNVNARCPCWLPDDFR